jgi:hypothetical protein
MEGLSNIVFQSPKHVWAMSLASGYNFGVFCGTSSLTMRGEMSKQFGPHIIRIKNLRAFAEEVQVLLGARRFYFNHVSYNDLKMFRTKTLQTLRLSRDDPPGNFDANLVTDAVFELLHKNSFLPSLFMKPTRFSKENELRLVFEMPVDISAPHVLRMVNPNLVKHIEFIS